ncbi:transposase [Kitasatospora sp. NBC_00240]|uniref:transposase n=1 Tax=Kitasatospora sp. NBC_00240 TaxID=2903567 RepID=UPI00224CF026|nr:transposase [Kitasatospora sp. NBC_00240]MCX5216234.1 transposase [Kitasatospora sp. NBC_00240]
MNGHVEVGPGAVLRLEDGEWTVRDVLTASGEVVLVSADGGVRVWTLGLLAGKVRGGSGPTVAREDLSEDQLVLLRIRVAHALEADCGFRSGDPARPEPGEPREGYDPLVTTKEQRLGRKVAELAGLHPAEAGRLGLEQVSERTLRRLAGQWRDGGQRLEACADGRWFRTSPGRTSVSVQVEEAIEAVRVECLHRSRVSMRTREKLIHQYVRDRFGDQTAVPSYTTLSRVWQEWYGPGGTRQRYQRSAAAIDAGGSSILITRPGQVAALDTTPLPVLLREHAFGDAVSAHLTWAMDVFTRSLVAFRLTLGSDTAVDVGLLLRDVMLPLPMRPGWGEDMAWPYPGVPAAVVAEFAGYEVAGLPFFAPDTVTTDHGSVYKSHHLVEVEQRLGCSILPARMMRATDKAACERAFLSAQTLLFESLPGFRGVDVADRGADPEGDAVLTLAQMEHLIATWIVGTWQNRRLGEHAPPWAPNERHSPNTLFAASFAQGGFGLRIPSSDLYYGVLPASYVKIHRKRGVKIRSLWYDGPAVDDYRGKPSQRRGRHPGLWRIRHDPRDRREVFFEDPATGDWHPLRWTGLPPEGEIPPFSDAKVDEMIALARDSGLVPVDDRDLLPVLLDLLDEHAPVERWPGRAAKEAGGKRRRAGQAREESRALTAERDRRRPRQGTKPTAPAEVVVLRRDQVARAVDEDRRRRREQAVPGPPPLPGPLGGHRTRDLFALPPDDEGQPDD